MNPSTRSRSSRSGLGLAALLALALAAFLAFAAPALAAPPAFSGEEITEANASPLAAPWGMSFDSSGNLFLADSVEKVIDEYDSSNAFAAPIGAGELPTNGNSAGYVRSVAVNDTTGVLYVALSEPEKIAVFKPDGSGGYEEPVVFEVPGGYTYVAVDNSSSARAGDLYVETAFGSGQHIKILETNATTGEIETEWNLSTPELAPKAGGEFHLINQANGEGGLAVDPATGDVYVAEFGGGALNTGIVAVYSPAGVRDEANEISVTEPTGVAVGPDGKIYVLSSAGTGSVKVFSSGHVAEGELEETGNTGAFPFTAPRGVAVSAAGQVYVSDGSKVDIFGTPSGSAELRAYHDQNRYRFGHGGDRMRRRHRLRTVHQPDRRKHRSQGHRDPGGRF